MITISGKNFDFDEPKLSLEDLAYHLSRVSRWAGIPKNWSVLDHSICMAVSFMGHDSEHVLHAALHDAHEMIIGDIASPMKIDLITEIQEFYQSFVLKAIDAPTPNGDIVSRVKLHDKVMMLAECEMVVPRRIREIIYEKKMEFFLVDKIVMSKLNSFKAIIRGYRFTHKFLGINPIGRFCRIVSHNRDAVNGIK